jgi:hypothetical protein
MKKANLTTAEYAPYYEVYLKNVANDTSLLDGFQKSLTSTPAYFQNLPKEKLLHQYDDGKWTPKEILQHLTDTERIFTYRALRISRNDKTELPGFDENAYVPPSQANLKTLDQLLDEFVSLRKANIALYKGFSDEMLLRLGKASGGPVSVRAIPFILLGHEMHHIRIIKERYF